MHTVNYKILSNTLGWITILADCKSLGGFPRRFCINNNKVINNELKLLISSELGLKYDMVKPIMVN